MTTSLDPVFALLDDCDEAVVELESRCCEPGRSPRMVALADTLAAARSRLAEMREDPAAAPAVIATLENAGSQIGWLQIGCCAPSRLPLYERLLKNLMSVQREVTKHAGGGH